MKPKTLVSGKVYIQLDEIDESHMDKIIESLKEMQVYFTRKRLIYTILFKERF